MFQSKLVILCPPLIFFFKSRNIMSATLKFWRNRIMTTQNIQICNCCEVVSTESDHFFFTIVYIPKLWSIQLWHFHVLSIFTYTYMVWILYIKVKTTFFFYLVQNFLVKSKMFRVHLLLFYSYYNRYIVYNICLYGRAVPRIKLERLCSEVFLSSMFMSNNVILLV